MKILLDIDGVMVTTPAWRPVEAEPDGFFKFNEVASRNLKALVGEGQAEIVLATSHRINFSEQEWQLIFERRGIFPSHVSKVNSAATLAAMRSRIEEVEEWVGKLGAGEVFVIIDDDASLRGLPSLILEKCVLTESYKGLDNEAVKKALSIIQMQRA